jgi:hypothetical protein
MWWSLIKVVVVFVAIYEIFFEGSSRSSVPRVPKLSNPEAKVKSGEWIQRTFKDSSDIGYWEASTGKFLGSEQGGTRRGYATRQAQVKKGKG